MAGRISIPSRDENVMAECHKAKFRIVRWSVIAYEDIPKDRTYRNAWAHEHGKPIHHDIAKAKEIHRDHMRTFRAAKMAALDVAYQRADEKRRRNRVSGRRAPRSRHCAT
jgi:hypothetical protein